MKLVLALAIVVPFFGCQNESTTAPKEVRKKIAIQKKPASSNQAQKSAKESPKKPQAAAKNSNQESLSETVKSPVSSDTQPLPGTTARRPPMIALDPFKSIIQREREIETSAAEPKKTKSRKREPQTPLERMHLSQFLLTAIYKTPTGYKALVEEPSGKGYIIEKGTWIGTNAGIVQEVTEDAVIIEEEVESAIGEISLETIALELPNPFGE